MGQITSATIKMIRDYIARGEHPPLTVHEIDQLVTAWERGQPAASAEPVPSEIEQMATTRYRPVPDGLLRYKVVAGDGTRALYHGTKQECLIVARKLAEAFLDGAYTAPVVAQPQLSGNAGELRAALVALTTATNHSDYGKALERARKALAAQPSAPESVICVLNKLWEAIQGMEHMPGWQDVARARADLGLAPAPKEDQS